MNSSNPNPTQRRYYPTVCEVRRKISSNESSQFNEGYANRLVVSRLDYQRLNEALGIRNSALLHQSDLQIDRRREKELSFSSLFYQSEGYIDEAMAPWFSPNSADLLVAKNSAIHKVCYAL